MTRAGARAGAAKIHKLSCLQFASAAGAAVPLWRIGGQGAGIVGGAEEKGKTRPTKAERRPHLGASPDCLASAGTTFFPAFSDRVCKDLFHGPNMVCDFGIRVSAPLVILK